MKLLYCYSKSNQLQDILWGFIELGIEVILNDKFNNEFAVGDELEADAKEIEMCIKSEKCDGVLSWNYFAAASIACERVGIPYISWTFDSPVIHTYSNTMLNSCNYIFAFDKLQYMDIKSKGGNCFYLPLAVNDTRLGGIEITDDDIAGYASEVSFVGSLYNDTAYDALKARVNQDIAAHHYKLFEKQHGNWKDDYLYTGISDNDVEEMEKMVPIDGIKDYSYINKHELYVGLMVARGMAGYERAKILNELGKCFPVTLFTNSNTNELKNIKCNPGVHYETEVSKVYFASKINLNMTLRSIKSGLPLRVFDIMGVGGFLMSNYQKEFEDLYVPDKEVVLYSSMDELIDKTRFYLSHERERLIIAMNGYKRTIAEHTMKHRAATILKTVYGLAV